MSEINKSNSREAAQIVLDKVESWEELNAATEALGNKEFNAAAKKYWKEFAVSGVLQFRDGKQTLQPFTDLDGNSALGLLKMAGIDTGDLTYVKPGEHKKGTTNLDTGDKFGVVYDEDTYTAFFDHHKPGTKEVTSTAEIMYKTLVALGLLEQSEALDRVVEFVNKIDNRKFAAEEFLRSAKTLLGLQRGLKFDQLVAYFKDHTSPTDELTPEEWGKYGLRKAAEDQQKVIDSSMETLARMEGEGKVVLLPIYGSVVINENNELKAGSSAAYVRHDGILNITPGKSFAFTLKDKTIDEKELRARLGDKFQGKIIRGQMWIYNDVMPLALTLEDLIDALRTRAEVPEAFSSF